MSIESCIRIRQEMARFKIMFPFHELVEERKRDDTVKTWVFQQYWGMVVNQRMDIYIPMFDHRQ